LKIGKALQQKEDTKTGLQDNKLRKIPIED
jgi:hypothetical protein